MIFVDSHVHIYDCFDIDLLLDSALKNFRAAAAQHNCVQQDLACILLLTECESDNWFQGQLTTLQAAGQNHVAISRGWCVRETGGEDTLVAFRSDAPGVKIYLVAGRQVVTEEKLEVLALFATRRIKKGMSLSVTVEAIRQADALPVLPWGAGKWLGKRGETVRDYLSVHEKKRLFLGDNGGRPRFWPTPDLFDFAAKQGILVLPGSDPLPLPGEAARVGSFGFALTGDSSAGDALTLYLKKALLSAKTTPLPFGRLQSNGMFILNQLRLRLSS